MFLLPLLHASRVIFFLVFQPPHPTLVFRASAPALDAEGRVAELQKRTMTATTPPPLRCCRLQNLSIPRTVVSCGRVVWW